MRSGSFRNVINKLCFYKSYINKEDLALDNLKRLIRHKTLPNQIRISLSLSLFLSFATRSYWPLLQAGHPNWIRYPKWAVVYPYCRSTLHVPEAIREHRLWVLYFLRSAQLTLFILLKWFMRWEVSGCTTATSSLWWYVRNENNKGVTIIVSMFMYDDDHDWRSKFCPCKIKEIDEGNRWRTIVYIIFIQHFINLLLLHSSPIPFPKYYPTLYNITLYYNVPLLIPIVILVYHIISV